MSPLRQTAAVVAKDVLVELRAPVRVSGLFFYGFVLLLIAGFTSNTSDVMRQQAGGVLWLGMLLASTRSFDQSYAAEMEQGALEGMMLWPVHPLALYYGKAVANAFVLMLVGCALLPLAIVMFQVNVRGDVGALLATVVLGCMGLSAPGTLLAHITSQARGSSVLLPLLLFPTVVPTVIPAARATTLVMEGDPMGGQVAAWLAVLAVMVGTHWTLSGLLFAKALEEG